jgi:hypothetical protein
MLQQMHAPVQCWRSVFGLGMNKNKPHASLHSRVWMVVVAEAEDEK